MENSVKGFLFSAIGTVFLSLGLISAKYALSSIHPTVFSFVWCISASLWLILILIIVKRLGEVLLPVRARRNVAILGIATGVGMILSWSGLRYLDPSFAAFLWRFLPVLTILAGVILFKEKLHLTEIPPIVVMIAGGVISTVGRWEIVGIGVILTLLACLTGVVQMIIGKVESTTVHPVVLSFYRTFLSAVVIGVWMIITGKFDFCAPYKYWLVTIIGALCGPGLGFLFVFASYRYWDLARSSVVLITQPIIVLPLANYLLGQFPATQELIGGMIILVGAFWIGWLGIRRWRNG